MAAAAALSMRLVGARCKGAAAAGAVARAGAAAHNWPA